MFESGPAPELRSSHLCLHLCPHLCRACPLLSWDCLPPWGGSGWGWRPRKSELPAAPSCLARGGKPGPRRWAPGPGSPGVFLQCRQRPLLGGVWMGNRSKASGWSGLRTEWPPWALSRGQCLAWGPQVSRVTALLSGGAAHCPRLASARGSRWSVEAKSDLEPQLAGERRGPECRAPSLPVLHPRPGPGRSLRHTPGEGSTLPALCPQPQPLGPSPWAQAPLATP